LIRILTHKDNANTEVIKQIKGYQTATSRMNKTMSLEEREKIKALLERIMDAADELNAELQECMIAFNEF